MVEIAPSVVEKRAIAETLWFLPPPGRMMIADKLHGLGLRYHSELATLALEREGPVELGNHAPQRVVSKESVNEGLDALRKINPLLAARIDAARNDPEMAAKIAEATTKGQQDVIAKAVGIDMDQVANIGDHVAQAVQENPPTENNSTAAGPATS